MTALISHAFLQEYWWIIISVLASLLVFLMFVQGGQSMIFSLPDNDIRRTLIINSMGRKWEFTFTTLVTFGGVFFAAFPLFYATSFGGAYWVWILILFSFIIQAIAYEYRSKPSNILGQRTFDRLEQINIPVIAAVNGFALGGGCELTMACDFRIASSKAKFGQPEVNLGMIPGYAGTQRLSRLAGLGNALYLLMTADMITAEEALRMGLVQKVTEPDVLLAEVMEIAKKIASKGPKAVKKVKAVTRKGFQIKFAEGSELEAREFGTLFKDEGEEGMKAFLEKRKPEWQ